MAWQYEISLPPDGGSGGATFIVKQNAAWEQVGLVWNKPASGELVNLDYGGTIIDIGSALDQTQEKGVGVHFNPYTVLVRMQYKIGASPDNAASQWYSSALNLLYHGDLGDLLDANDPAIANRDKLIIIGAEDNPIQKQQKGEAFAYQNLVMYVADVSTAGIATVTADDIPMPPPR